MRRYIDIVTEYMVEAILDQLEPVPMPGNTSKEIGSGGSKVQNHMPDMLPHNTIPERNYPKSYADIFIKAKGDAHNDSFEREPAPAPRSMKARRNNRAGVSSFKPISAKGDGGALLHHDYAGSRPATQSLVPLKRR